MDGGIREEAEMEKIKATVRQSYSFRRAARSKKAKWKSQCFPLESNEHLTHDQESVPNKQATAETMSNALIPKTRPSRSPEEFPTPTPQSISLNEGIDKITYFLDRVFFHQHHFYRRDPSSPDKIRGWLLGVNLECPEFYLSSMAISTLHQNLLNKLPSTQQRYLPVAEYEGYHSMTVTTLRAAINRLSDITDAFAYRKALSLLSTSLQLYSFEIFRSNKFGQRDMGDWEIYLGGAATLLSLMDKTLWANGLPTDPASNNRDPHKNEISPRDIIGLHFGRRIFVWADIIHNATMGWHHSLHREYPYLKYLGDGTVELGSLMGCSNWVMICILEISRLDALKQERHSLPSKSKAAYENFYPQIISLEKQLLDGTKSTRQEAGGEEKCYDIELKRVTETFTIAALIYLYIISWNAQAGYPTIHALVERAIKAIKRLPVNRLRSIPWAYCVVGCMASESQKGFFRGISATGVKSGVYLGTVLGALDIMEKWWEMREEKAADRKSGSVPWRMAIKELKIRALLS